MNDPIFPPSPSRRSFLAGSAALVAASTLLPEIAAQTPPDPAFPRGKRRDLLAKACTPDRLHSALVPMASYRPFPTIEDRGAWEAIRPETRATFVSRGEQYLKYAWPEMPATVFLEYARIGNRTNYQKLRDARNGALKSLVFAECVEAKGRFLDDIANGLWATCEESFWGVPAHLYIQKADLGLPDPHDPIVDLFAAETAALVATSVYLLGTRLDAISPQIRERVDFEAERRILDPCLAQNFMWMGLPGGKTRHDLPWIEVPEGVVQPVNNWDAWICWNWLTTLLFLDRKEDRRARGVEKVVKCLDQFINSYPDDGGCEEGPGYWNVACGAMFDTLELLHSSTRGAIDIFANPLLREMALYMNRVHVTDRYYLNPGDASPLISLDPDKMFRMAKRLKDSSLVALAVSSIRQPYLPATLPAIFNEDALLKEPAVPAELLRDVWLPETRVMAARQTANSAAGLYLAAIASDNGKSHSHNDTGNVWVYADGLPVLIDLGQEAYQKKSFDAHRYEIPSTQSAFHNLPAIGGVQQGVGPQFRATEVVYHSSASMPQLEMELATAYPPAASLRSWKRTVSLDRGRKQIVMTDRFALSKPVADIFLSLMTSCAVTQTQSGILSLASLKQSASPVRIAFDPAVLTATVETVPLENSELVQNWGPQVYRIHLVVKGQATSGRIGLTISQS